MIILLRGIFIGLYAFRLSSQEFSMTVVQAWDGAVGIWVFGIIQSAKLLLVSS